MKFRRVQYFQSQFSDLEVLQAHFEESGHGPEHCTYVEMRSEVQYEYEDGEERE